MRVFVGLSGGVDSSVAAALLKQEGHQVEGVYLLGYQPPFMKCPAAEDRTDAMRVAAHLGIPFHTLDLSESYKKEVVDYLISEYAAGRTPNPDIMCNKHIKFGGFFEWALAHGADAIATGHYARKGAEPTSLVAAKDTNKDQTYFLWALSKEALSKTLFPVGNFTKPEIREMAKELGLPTAAKKDSQGVCFLGKIDMDEFLAREIPHIQGVVLNAKGEVIGHHSGAKFLTIGQRHGFIVTKKTPNDAPYYIVSKDVEQNTITVDANPHRETSNSDTVTLHSTNWFIAPPEVGVRINARARHRQPYFEVEIVASASASVSVSDTATVRIISPNIGPFASGQSLVLYDGSTCLGGGIIA